MRPLVGTLTSLCLLNLEQILPLWMEQILPHLRQQQRLMEQRRQTLLLMLIHPRLSSQSRRSSRRLSRRRLPLQLEWRMRLEACPLK